VRVPVGLGEVVAIPSEGVSVDAALPAGLPSATTLRLAEPAAPGWRVSVDGSPAALGPGPHGLPTSVAALRGADGRLVVEHTGSRPRWVLAQGVVLLLLLVALVPVRRPTADVVTTRRPADRRRRR
jgi:hypothetical protein